MIKLTTLDKREIYLNPELVEQLERVPETVITLTNGKKMLVCESVEEVVQRIMTYRQQIHGVQTPVNLEVK
ncbi:flagellar FlbD family protein [Zhaonella formicivorans]|jgi:flagellar protein FlbD|uniref:flagellar FlbD family protein n=1 Tax=Zhaonella formicivorans TaxID=2528593 RepID=UPI0010D9BE67|nr:flagellar FlbD family protein [Zhaonella formicivorans]